MQLESLEQSKGNLDGEMKRMKETYDKSKSEYIKLISSEHDKMLDQIDDLRKNLDKQEMQLSLTTSKGTSNYNLIKELQNTSDELHKGLEKC